MLLKIAGITAIIVPLTLWCISPSWWHAARIGVPKYSFEVGVFRDGISIIFNSDPLRTTWAAKCYGDWVSNPMVRGAWVPERFYVERGDVTGTTFGFIRSTSLLECRYTSAVVPHWVFTLSGVVVGVLLYRWGVRRSRTRSGEPGGFPAISKTEKISGVVTKALALTITVTD